MTKASKEGQRKAPILRFKGFTDAWEQRKLGEIFKFSQGLQVPIDQQFERKEENTERFIRIVDVTQDNIPQRFVYNPTGKGRVNLDDIFFVRYGAVGTIGHGFKGVIANNLFKVIPLIDINPLFWFYQFSDIRFNSRLKALSASTSMPAINFNTLRKMIISNTSIVEQNKIGTILKSLDNLLTLYEKKKQLLTQLKQGIVNFLITKNGPKPQLRFSGFNNNWESKSFEKLLNYEQPTKYIVKKADYISQGTPVLTANKSFVLGYTNETNVYQNIPAIIFDDFTLESKYVDFPFMVKSSAIKILTSENSNLFFIYQLLNNQRFVQEGHSRHYISVVQKKKVLVPSIQEQNKISDLIKQLEDNIELNSNTIVLLKKLKEFLLQSMFL